MKLSSIWSLPSYPLAERLRRTRDWAAQEIGRRLPLRIRFWVTLQEIGKATMTSPDVPATSCDTIIRNLETPRNLS